MINPLLLLDLPTDPVKAGRTDHNGGKVVVGPDSNVYLIVGEVGGHRTQAQNIADGPAPNGLGGVLRVTQDGQIVESNTPIFGEESPLNIYYAMGIRNSFGMDFDPLTGNLWDTENGPSAGDEINLVAPGFNSGWALIQGYADNNNNDNDDVTLQGDESYPENLVYFGNSHYSDPEFVWINPIGITDITFLDSDKLGKQYTNNMFVGDINNGYLYRFVLNDLRNGILVDEGFNGNMEALSDNEVDEPGESQSLVFGRGFGGITDIEVGMDGYLYVLTYSGSLYRVLPST
jgi:glucose/arabinose dehydrogenase